MLIAKLTGYLLETTGQLSACVPDRRVAYLTALVIIHLLAPRLEPVEAVEASVIASIRINGYSSVRT
jgi:hypothetical protein